MNPDYTVVAVVVVVAAAVDGDDGAMTIHSRKNRNHRRRTTMRRRDVSYMITSQERERIASRALIGTEASCLTAGSTVVEWSTMIYIAEIDSARNRMACRDVRVQMYV